MKQTFILCLLALSSIVLRAQVYDSAVRYRMTVPTFYEAADSLIAQASANPADTGEGSNTNALINFKDFMGRRISNDVPAGTEQKNNHSLIYEF